jgi:hypothetical protein
MNKDFDLSKLSQNELIIKILEFVCENKDKNVITAALVKRDLFPELDENEILHLFDVIKHQGISQILIVEGNHHYLKYRVGLEDYIKGRKKITKKEKLHRIVEFLSTEKDKHNKSSFNSGEIAKAFSPELNIYEVNSLLEIIINNNDINQYSSKDITASRMLAVSVTNKTHTAYHTKKYLEEDEQFSIPINQNISGNNVIVGNVSGTAKQEVNTGTTTKGKGKPKWLKWLFWILGALVLIAGLIEGIRRIF